MQRVDPVLSLAMGNISKIDKVDCDRLSSLWTVFTKCAGNLENGHRLENLSWRLWYRECQLLDRERHVESEQAPDATHQQQTKKDDLNSDANLPPLSRSVESANSDEMDGKVHTDMMGHKSSGHHLTPDRFHELVTQFGQESTDHRAWSAVSDSQQSKGNEYLAARRDSNKSTEPRLRSRCVSRETSGLASACTVDETALSTGKTSVSQVHAVSGLRRASSVVHGFNPSCASTKQCTDDVSLLCQGKSMRSLENKSMFFIDSSPSESDHENDMHSSTRARTRAARSPIRSPVHLVSVSLAPASKRHTSFKEIVDEGSEYESSPFDTDDESETDPTDQHGESAIMTDEEEDGNVGTMTKNKSVLEEDDDDWDSVCSESHANSPQMPAMFDKVGTDVHRPALLSRKSILSTLLTNPMTRLSNPQSKSSPAISQSQRASPKETELQAHIPVILSPHALTDSIAHPTAIKGSVSPRTTRRNMLATELSESLRRHLLWERQQKSGSSGTASQTILKRRHTAYDLTKVQAFPLTSSSFDANQKHEVATDNEFGYNGAGW